MVQNPFSVRRWIYVPQVPDRRNLRFAVSKVLSFEYVMEVRYFGYEYFVYINSIRGSKPSDVLAMLDMYDGITLVREDQDK